ncbi:MAG: reverse transcriptase family protein [Bacteroidota bacterium]
MLPHDWTDANISSIHKKGSKLSPNNYRPISLTSQIIKLMERLILDHINNLLQRNNTINCVQHGFQDKCSCVTQLLDCLNDWTINFDQSRETDIIYLDFKKAFDTVPHQRLLHKLRQVGVRGKILYWIENFLTSRRQRVILKNGTSSWLHVHSGVPQGSILGPTLFLIYVNDLPEIISTTAKMFADDTKIYAKIQSIQDCINLQNDLNALSAWSRKWLLNFNESKCIVVRIRHSLLYQYTLKGFPLDELKNQKDLGITISNDLHPSTHISYISSKANQRIGLIKRCFFPLTNQKVQLLYESIIRPLLEYGSPVWNPWLKKDIHELDKIQDRCLKLAPIPPNLPSLQVRRNMLDLCEVYKYLHGYYKIGAPTYFTFPNRQLRGHSYKLSKIFSRTDVRKYFFSNRVVDAWNALPEDVVTAPNLDAFKKKLRSLSEDEEG